MDRTAVRGPHVPCRNATPTAKIKDKKEDRGRVINVPGRGEEKNKGGGGTFWEGTKREKTIEKWVTYKKDETRICKSGCGKPLGKGGKQKA